MRLLTDQTGSLQRDWHGLERCTSPLLGFGRQGAWLLGACPREQGGAGYGL